MQDGERTNVRNSLKGHITNLGNGLNNLVSNMTWLLLTKTTSTHLEEGIKSKHSLTISLQATMLNLYWGVATNQHTGTMTRTIILYGLEYALMIADKYPSQLHMSTKKYAELNWI